MKAFCESGGKVKQGDEVLFLPPIVDAAESSPAAAAECARLIRNYLSRDYIRRPAWQYNAIMLLRILADNPGETFTRNLDQKFVDTMKQLLKGVRDHSVRQILMETLDDFENTKQHDGNLALAVSMWKKEKEKAWKGQPLQRPAPPPQQMWAAPQFNPHSQNYFARNHTNKTLPEPVELAHRLEEARTSAKLLEQVVMNTPPSEFLENDLIKEFADRCQSASRSIQGYMISENPAPDNDTMENLIDTNEQLQKALNQHKRAILNARKQLGLGGRDGDSPNETPSMNGSDNRQSLLGSTQTSGFNLGGPPLSIRPPADGGKGKQTYTPPPGPPPGVGPSGDATSGSGPSRYPPEPPQETHGLDDPFRDPQPTGPYNTQPVMAFTGDYSQHNALPPEPYHPGFKTTESYMGRQDTAADKLIMHGAGTKPTPTVSTNAPPARKPLQEVSDDDDLYDASPKAKEPMYRY